MVEPVIIGRATLYNADCRDVLPLLDGIGAVVTDPPYGLGFPYSGYNDTRDALVELIAAFVPACRALAERVVITPGVTNLQLYPEADWIGAWTWGTTATYGRLGYSQWQPILFYGQDVDGFGSVNGVLKSDRLQVDGFASKDNMEKGGGHCCPKPLAFVERAIQRFTLPGETVLDPFMGSGTTGVAALMSGRSFIGCEIDPGYFDIACSRLRKVSGDDAGPLFGEAA